MTSVSAFDKTRLIDNLQGTNIVGFYCSDPQEDKVKTYSTAIKKLERTCFGRGPSTLSNPSFLYHDCDIVVHGEGEKTILEIVEHYEGKKE